ncbi:GAF and ANTAR domain-containing protein [Aeromicrobium sp.]|uniref:GAF and ANTAR domain-containing protein n=1 Tax=Aeromicrobium sp. TaxID=1871063 RepID=UPI0028AE1E47|nr:GAF and ANTAR domain-containing protein [Aeromicrobium sp.]
MTMEMPPGASSPSDQPDPLSLAGAVLALYEAADSDQTIERVTSYSRAATGCDDAGVMVLLSRHRIRTAGATSAVVSRAHDLQVEFDEGPCPAGPERAETVHIEDTTTDPRWPRWSSAVAGLGYRSVLSVPLLTRGRRYGSLTTFSHEARAFHEEDLAVLTILARHASASLATHLDIERLQFAVEARKLVGIAMGMMMERYELDTDHAFDVLRRISEAEDLTLRDVACRVVDRRCSPWT